MSQRAVSFSKLAVALGATVLVGSCLNGNGLDTGAGGATGSQGGTQGSGASGGGTGKAGNNGSGGAAQCGPVCDIFCEYGNVTDGNGCPTCACNSAPDCPAVKCAGDCPNGFAKDDRGCTTCMCAPGPTMCSPRECGAAPLPQIACADGSTPPVSCERNATGLCSWRVGMCPVSMCPGVACNLFCPYGNLKDANGCDLCKCNPAPACSAGECGAPPPVAAIPCGDGTIAPGPKCTRNPDGKCTWQLGMCPTPCADFRDLKTCEVDGRCQWLEPGCSGVTLPVAGCFSKTDVNCKDSSCTGGRTCQKRTVDYCKGRPNMACITCASPTNVCL